MFALVALAGAAMADIDSLTLSPTYTAANGTVKNMVENYVARDSGSDIMSRFTGDGTPGYTTDSISFTFDVKNMEGAEKVSDTDILTLNSLTYYGQTQQYFIGGALRES